MTKRPIHEIRFGTIKASIWENQRNKTGVNHNVTLVRLYKNGDSWVQSSHLFRDDLLVAAKALDLAHTWINTHRQSIGEERNGVQE